MEFDVDVMLRSGLELQMRANSLALLSMACGLLPFSTNEDFCLSTGSSCHLGADGAAETVALIAKAIKSNSVFR